MAASFESFIVKDGSNENDGGKQQRQLPCILSPPQSSSTISSAQDTSNFIKENRQKIDQSLQEHGAVLFRGFPLKDVQDFDMFVSSWEDWQDLSYDRSMSFAVRHKLSNRICTTNEGKSGGLVFHHEQAQTPLWPSYVFFCCVLPAKPGDGGATGLVSSHLVYKELKQKYPEFIDKCETHGVRYTVYAGAEQDPTKGAGRSWKSFFHASTKEECELKMKAGGWDYEWGGIGPNGNQLDADYLKCTTPVLEAVKVAPGSGSSSSSTSNDNKKCFFNQLIATTANALEFSRVGTLGGGYDPSIDIPTQEGIDACVKFGDGSSVSLDILLDAKQICEDKAIDVCWEQGDVALVSNYLMMHARRPWNGPEGTRKVVASLVSEENCTSFGKQLVAM